MKPASRCFRCHRGWDGPGLVCLDCQQEEAEHARRAGLTVEQRKYEDAYGREAQERQTALAGERWTCCAESRGGPHHVGCAKYVEEPAAVHEDQGALL